MDLEFEGEAVSAISAMVLEKPCVLRVSEQVSVADVMKTDNRIA